MAQEDKPNTLICLVHHPEVQSGRAITPYHQGRWRPMDELPPRYQKWSPLIDLMINGGKWEDEENLPTSDLWAAEGFRILSERPATLFSLVMRYGSKAPIHVPILSKPRIKMSEVVDPDFLGEKKIVKGLGGKEVVCLKFPGNQFVSSELTPEEEVVGAVIPGFSEARITPFYLLDAKKFQQERVVLGEDPFRIVIHLMGLPGVKQEKAVTSRRDFVSFAELYTMTRFVMLVAQYAPTMWKLYQSYRKLR